MSLHPASGRLPRRCSIRDYITGKHCRSARICTWCQLSSSRCLEVTHSAYWQYCFIQNISDLTKKNKAKNENWTEHICLHRMWRPWNGEPWLTQWWHHSSYCTLARKFTLDNGHWHTSWDSLLKYSYRSLLDNLPHCSWWFDEQQLELDSNSAEVTNPDQDQSSKERNESDAPPAES